VPISEKAQISQKGKTVEIQTIQTRGGKKSRDCGHLVNVLKLENFHPENHNCRRNLNSSRFQIKMIFSKLVLLFSYYFTFYTSIGLCILS
jgi:hypothetical protein